MLLRISIYIVSESTANVWACPFVCSIHKYSVYRMKLLMETRVHNIEKKNRENKKVVENHSTHAISKIESVVVAVWDSIASHIYEYFLLTRPIDVSWQYKRIFHFIFNNIYIHVYMRYMLWNSLHDLRQTIYECCAVWFVVYSISLVVYDRLFFSGYPQTHTHIEYISYYYYFYYLMFIRV